MTDFLIDKVKFNEQGLIPAVIQEASTGKILMLAYMNKESLLKTLETNRTWFYSRSRNKLWNKGETSGNYQIVNAIDMDCDGDTLLIEVFQTGNACHTGETSCFHQNIFTADSCKDEDFREDILKELYGLILDRRNNPKENSYTSYLFEKGIDKIVKKIGEEASEIIIAAKNNNKDETIYEIADFVYHLLVLMVSKEISIDNIKMELIKRNIK